MRGSIVKRSRWSWSLVVDQGRDPTTSKRKQRWIRFEVPRDKSQREAMKLAEAKLAEVLHQVDKGTFVEASKTTLIEYLRSWHAKAVAPLKRPETARVYSSFIETHVAKASIGSMPLQKVRKTDLEHFYNVGLAKLSASSITVAHAMLSKALRDAVEDGLIAFSPAPLARNRRKVEKSASTENAQQHCWSADEARTFLRVAKETASPQMSAFVSVALDSGMRRSELCGLLWEDIDLDSGAVMVRRQLDKAGTEPAFGPLKTKRQRKVSLGAETALRLRAHKREQAKLKMANRVTYADFGLVFAREPEHLQTPNAKLGEPVKRVLDDAAFKRLVKAAGVRPIRFHGLRHTCATLLLQAGIPVHEVAHRLGHVDATMTLSTYAHANPTRDAEAAARLAAVLHG